MPEGEALPQLGTGLEEASSDSRAQGGKNARAGVTNPDVKDYFQERDGQRFAGTHLIVDLWNARHLDDRAHVEATLRACVAAAGATLLHLHLHRFTPQGGISGVAVLAESHISIHTWPERSYAALDVFMCGDTEPRAAIAVLRQAFPEARLLVEEHLRGRVEV